MLALSDWTATLGIIGIFGVLFPVLANVLIVFAIGQALGERNQNQRYQRHGRGGAS